MYKGLFWPLYIIVLLNTKKQPFKMSRSPITLSSWENRLGGVNLLNITELVGDAR